LTLRPGHTPLRALAAAFNPRMDGEGAAEYATKITNEPDKLRSGDPELFSHMITILRCVASVGIAARARVSSCPSPGITSRRNSWRAAR
jgi:hypothetical protein